MAVDLEKLGQLLDEALAKESAESWTKKEKEYLKKLKGVSDKEDNSIKTKNNMENNNEFVEFTHLNGKKFSVRRSEIVTFENKMIELSRDHFFEFDIQENYDEIKKILGIC